VARAPIPEHPAGPRQGAHRLRNASPESCRLLFISELNFPDIVSYPDTGTTLGVTAPTSRLAFPGGSDGPAADLMPPRLMLTRADHVTESGYANLLR
jgi:hypothetical protein